jgi:hypothetical protein
MKRLLAQGRVASVLLALTLSAGLPHTAQAQMPLSDCAPVASLAATIMTERHRNADIMLMLNKMTAEYSDHAELLTWATAMVDSAWAQPIAQGAEAQTQQVAQFREQWLQRCEARRTAAN